MDIPRQIAYFEQQAISKKNLLFSFLENFNIGNDRSINDYITDKILLLENSGPTQDNQGIEGNTYTYWMDGGLSWFYWYKKNLSEVTAKESISMSICNLKFHYVFNEIVHWQQKTVKIHTLMQQLQAHLKLMNIDTELETTNFTYDPARAVSKYEFYYEKIVQKEPFYNIKLILKSNVARGGMRSPKKEKKFYSTADIRKRREIRKTISSIHREGEFKSKQVENFKKLAQPFTHERLPELAQLNGKILAEFQLEYFDPFKFVDEGVSYRFDIANFKKYYINEFEQKDIYQYNSIIDPVFARKFLNRLNLMGLITFSYLNNSKKESESGLNIERLRQNYLIQKIKKRKNPFDAINNIFGDVKSYYITYFENFRCFNPFFIEKIDILLVEHNLYKYSTFVDTIDKYFMTLFRPAINSFIVDLNEELYRKHKVKLFIAGGDAMRRYNYDISFTSDIDCKLHIKNADGGANAKESISSIVLQHVVKLRNYLEENKTIVLADIISERNRGLEVFRHDHDNNEIRIDVLLNKADSNDYQQFRVRDNKKNDAMPVDLFSIDFRYNISYYNFGRLFNQFKHLVSILDVVIIDDKDYKPDDIESVNGVAYASKTFLLKDFETTYNNEDMALGRISNDKTKKDIQRYNQMKLDNPDAYTPYINRIVELFSSINIQAITHQGFRGIIEKIINRRFVSIHDYIVLKNLTQRDVKPILDSNTIMKFLNDITESTINLPFEDLNRIDPRYHDYNYSDSPIDIIKRYLDIYSIIIGNKNDGLYKHAAPFNIQELRRYISTVEFRPPAQPLQPIDYSARAARAAARAARGSSGGGRRGKQIKK